MEAERQMSNEPFIVFVGTETQLPWLRAYDDITIDHELVSRLATHGLDGRTDQGSKVLQELRPARLEFQPAKTSRSASANQMLPPLI